jgi:hypothetical protein
MKRRKKRVTIATSVIIVIVIVIAGYFYAPYLLSRLIEHKILESFQKLREKGITIEYDTLYSIPGKVAAKNLKVTAPSVNGECTQNNSKAVFSTIEIAGIHIMPLIFSNTLEIDSLVINKSEIDYAEQKRTTEKQENEKIENISVGYLSLQTTIIKVIDSASCKPIKTCEVEQLTIHKLGATDLHLDSIKWSADEAMVFLAKLQFTEELYTVNLKHVSYSRFTKTFNIDSLQIIPDKDKAAFAIQKVNQTDRIHCILPYIKIKGFEIISLNKPLVYAECINLNTWLDVFRDKRYPFRNKPKDLPMKFLRTLPFLLQIDTIKLLDSYIAYEEFPEEGDKAGHVFFNNIYGTIYNLSNNSTNDTEIDVTANFMNAGTLKGNFSLPSDEQKPYTAKGSLVNFELSKVNPMLTPAANAEISEGKMKELKFNFIYNETRSDGKLEMNYKGLKIITLKKEERESNKFLTFLLNLVVKDDMNTKGKEDNNTGTILFYRDPRKSIFNYWWKSILSGIKSVYNLDKIMDTDGKK